MIDPCLCTHANTSHRHGDCIGFEPLSEKLYVCHACGGYADQHHCSECDCEEYWNEEMARLLHWPRRRGVIKRNPDGTKRLIELIEEELMPPVAGGIEGEFQGRVYPVVIGLKAGPRTLHLCGEGTTWSENGAWLLVSEPTEPGMAPNLIQIPLENVAFIAAPMFLIETPTK